jgi:hypothetical protein
MVYSSISCVKKVLCFTTSISNELSIAVWVMFFLRWGGSHPSVHAYLHASILRISQMIRVWRATVEWQGKTEELGEKPVPVPFCPLQIPHELTRARTRASAVKVRRLTTWAMARPYALRLLLQCGEVQNIPSIAVISDVLCVPILVLIPLIHSPVLSGCTRDI